MAPELVAADTKDEVWIFHCFQGPPHTRVIKRIYDHTPIVGTVESFRDNWPDRKIDKLLFLSLNMGGCGLLLEICPLELQGARPLSLGDGNLLCPILGQTKNLQEERVARDFRVVVGPGREGWRLAGCIPILGMRVLLTKINFESMKALLKIVA